ncbi:probable envelope ADP,ATP carrier, chloroplastic [Olea europaea subsp. europaea]|uniref:Probable envelope ADP,ATP carrier, chloroplastic n=1 Tax=Olea europaea subsp. europaea TaxID=158383 RepID=A0A8S0RJV4_OLEEU|nr:probable envelope ADP,ATP carrier, chloroplastic [Olea europaea subsp. europaea]
MSKYDRNIHGSSLDLSHNSHTRMLSSGHRGQMQMKGTPYKTILDAISGMVSCDGWLGFYWGFVPNALTTQPNSSGGERAGAAYGSTRKIRLYPSPGAAYKPHEHKYGQPVCGLEWAILHN